MSDQKAPAELILGSAVRLSEDDRPNLKSAYLHYNQQAAIMAEQLAEAQAKIKIFEQITKLQAQEGAARMAESFDLRSKITNLELDIALLRLEQKWTACAYCTEHWDYTNLEDGAAKVAAHVAICPEHPMRALEAQNAEFTRERDALAAAIDLMGQVACYDHAWKDLTDAQRDEICRLSDNALGVVHSGGHGKILEAHDAALLKPVQDERDALSRSGAGLSLMIQKLQEDEYIEQLIKQIRSDAGTGRTYDSVAMEALAEGSINLLEAHDAALVGPLKTEIEQLTTLCKASAKLCGEERDAKENALTKLAERDTEIVRLENSILEADDYRTETGERDTIRAYRRISAEAAGIREEREKTHTEGGGQ